LSSEKKDDVEKDKKKDDVEKDKKEPEPTSELLSNPARVMKAQVRLTYLLTWLSGSAL